MEALFCPLQQYFTVLELTYISNLVYTRHFCDNLNLVRSNWTATSFQFWGARQRKGINMGRQNRLWSLMPEWGNLNFDNDCIFGEMKILMASTGISNKSCKCRNTYYWNISVYERLQDKLFSTGICCPNVCPLRIINVIIN